jgi:hypothetical protein
MRKFSFTDRVAWWANYIGLQVFKDHLGEYIWCDRLCKTEGGKIIEASLVALEVFDENGHE